MRATKDNEHLAEIKKSLRMQHYNEDEHHKQIGRHRMYLRDFSEDTYRTKMDLDCLRKTEQYLDWVSSNQSSLLALSGQNEQGIIERGGRCCWLSPAAIDFIDESRQSGRLVLYHLNLGHPHQRTDPTAHRVFTSLATQLLTKNSKLLRDPAEFSCLQTQVQEFDWEDDIEAICTFLITILNLLEDDSPVYIVVDRIDVCSGRVSEVELMNALLRTVQSVKCTLKILVVACANNWDMNKESRSLNTRKLSEGMFTKLIRDQELQDLY